MCGSGSARDSHLVTGLPERPFSSLWHHSDISDGPLWAGVCRVWRHVHCAVASLGMGDGWFETGSVLRHGSRTVSCRNGGDHVCASRQALGSMKGRSASTYHGEPARARMPWNSRWGLAGCGKTISAQQNFDGPHVLDKKRIPLRDSQKAVQQGRSERRGEAYASVR